MAEAYAKFQAHFHDAGTQENIRASKELNKLKICLTLSEEAELMSYFNEQKAKAQALQAQIDRTDKEIDRMVYALYGLTEEEIKIVEGKQ